MARGEQEGQGDSDVLAHGEDGARLGAELADGGEGVAQGEAGGAVEGGEGAAREADGGGGIDEAGGEAGGEVEGVDAGGGGCLGMRRRAIHEDDCDGAVDRIGRSARLFAEPSQAGCPGMARIVPPW